MLCVFTYSMVVAQVEVWALMSFLVALCGAIVSIISVRQSIKKAKSEHEDSFARKELLNEKIIAVNLQIMSINKEVDELKRDNQREHDAIKKEFVERVNMIFEWIKQKSA